MNHVDAVDRAGLNTQVAARTFTDDDSVHLFSRAEYGINGTGLYALGAANALIFANISNGRTFILLAVLLIQWNGFYIQQIGKGLYARLATGRALVDGFTICNCLRVGTATWMPALTTLGLWQDVIYLVGNRVALGLEADCRVSQQCAKCSRHSDEGSQRGEQGVL